MSGQLLKGRRGRKIKNCWLRKWTGLIVFHVGQYLMPPCSAVLLNALITVILSTEYILETSCSQMMSSTKIKLDIYGWCLIDMHYSSNDKAGNPQ